MSRVIYLLLGLAIARAALADGGGAAAEAPRPTPGGKTAVVRVAAIGAINDLDFWKAVAERFEQKTGVHVDTVATGNKDAAAELFARGGIDLITVQSADLVMGLVADGYAKDPQPWVRTELIVVGPKEDPARVSGCKTGAEAVRKILTGGAPFVVHGSLGADQVVRGIVQAGKGQIAEGRAVVLLDDHQKRVLQAAAEKRAYTLIAGLPFRAGKIPAGGLVELLKGDPAMRRPVVLAVADPRKIAGARVEEAKRLVEFLRSEETQQWIDRWRSAGAGQEFFRVDAGGEGKRE